MRLRLTGPNNQQVEHDIPRGGITTGRGSSNDIHLDDRTISRSQIRVSLDMDGRVILEDLGSRYGTFLNGRRLKFPVAIQPDDGFQFGSWFGDIYDESLDFGVERQTRQMRVVTSPELTPGRVITRKTAVLSPGTSPGKRRLVYWMSVGALVVLILTLLALLLQTQS